MAHWGRSVATKGPQGAIRAVRSATTGCLGHGLPLVLLDRPTYCMNWPLASPELLQARRWMSPEIAVLFGIILGFLSPQASYGDPPAFSEYSGHFAQLPQAQFHQVPPVPFPVQIGNLAWNWAFAIWPAPRSAYKPP